MTELSTPSANPAPLAPNNAPSGSPYGSRRRALALCAAAVVVVALGACGFAIAYPQYMPDAIGEIVEDMTGANAHPVALQRPSVAPLSAVAMLGKEIFFDTSLSASGKQSCATCHSPAHAYGPPNDLAVQMGGEHMTLQGYRPPPSLMYLYRQPNFSIGPDSAENDDNPANLAQLASQAAGTQRAQKTAGAAPAAAEMVPQGGLFWDGRVDTLQQQASGPMLNPVEMANKDDAEVLHKLQNARYAKTMMQLFGPNIFKDQRLAVAEAMFAVARYQIEDPSFHPYTSKYDYWLEGKARLSQAELRGLHLFNDPDKANCAGCHLSKPGRDGLPPMFTDFQYEALGVPRNTALTQNRDPHFFDMGICGPFRTDLKDQTQYCGMFLTPTLRNSATRHAFFHNGIYNNLDDVMAFYNARNTDPVRFYPRGADGKPEKYNDIPPAYRANVDVKDAPFDRKFGEQPAMTDQEMRDIVAFLHALTDGYGEQH
ncbi:cytochrome-c peroxidase [Paraburkholderia diazotrophica]|uniref:Cytochrome c peroxidase n=1 Tax=Paraburkholderia diazotrophica TaxID=667676 RepID=A0A1H7A206_9BURK|nr:cytochrome c peroxidase [Paraburkholderia diazotrophica]SEJ58474.1 cytochrome c peroxidase [Paraburkholderia diazotrophica]